MSSIVSNRGLRVLRRMQERHMPDLCTLRQPSYTSTGTGTTLTFSNFATAVPCRKVSPRQQPRESVQGSKALLRENDLVIIPQSYTTVDEGWRVLITSLNGASVSIELEVKSAKRTTDETARILECVRVGKPT